MNGLSEDIVKLGIPMLAIVMGCLVAIISIAVTGIRQVMQTRAREESRREIAAYIAEGSMSPDDGVRLINAGRPAKEAGCKGSA